MNYRAERSYTGLATVVKGFAEEPLSQMVWRAEYRPEKGDLWMRSYSYYERKTKRHKWIRTGSFGSWDRREDTLTALPPAPPELCDLMIAAFIADIKITSVK